MPFSVQICTRGKICTLVVIMRKEVSCFFSCIQISSIRGAGGAAWLGSSSADVVIGLTKDYVSVVDGASSVAPFVEQNKVDWN